MIPKKELNVIAITDMKSGQPELHLDGTRSFMEQIKNVANNTSNGILVGGGILAYAVVGGIVSGAGTLVGGLFAQLALTAAIPQITTLAAATLVGGGAIGGTLGLISGIVEEFKHNKKDFSYQNKLKQTRSAERNYNTSSNMNFVNETSYEDLALKNLTENSAKTAKSVEYCEEDPFHNDLIPRAYEVYKNEDGYISTKIKPM